MMEMAGVAPSAEAAKIERHAFDLSRQLQTQQSDLDQREAEFHAHLGQAEHELRVARLAASERAAQLAEREIELDRCEREAKAVLAKAMSQPNPVAADSHFAAAESQQQAQELKLTRESWRKRLREVEQSELQLQSQIAQISFQRRQMQQQQQENDEQFSQLITKIQTERRDEQARFEKQLLRLREREELVDRRELAVEQLHNDVTRMYREAIELRLCTEEQWAELTESASETELQVTRAEMRRKLMEQYQLAEQRIQDERQEVEALLAQLESHRTKIDEQRSELRGWAMKRNEEIERDAARLVEREQELNRQLSEHRFLEQQWTEQQAGYEQEIRRLRRLAKND
jgi:hypothetical protein